MTTNREKLIDTMRKLMERTRVRGCTEAEELEALAKCRAMRDVYDVTDEELALTKSEAVILHEEEKDLGDPHQIKWQLALAVGEYCDCRVWRHPSGGMRFCGARSDVEWATWLLDHLADFVAGELVLHFMTSLAPSSERKRVINGFLEGCCRRISDRIKQLCNPPVGQTKNAKQLIVLKSKAVDDKLCELGIKLRNTSSRRAVNERALEAGSKAGDRASLGRPVSGAASVLRIGKR